MWQNKFIGLATMTWPKLLDHYSPDYTTLSRRLRELNIKSPRYTKYSIMDESIAAIALGGGDLSVYSADMENALPKMENESEKQIAQLLWQSALSSHWEKPPVWVHGDYAAGNLLVKEGTLHAVIDFGCLAVGDPACDLAIAWHLLDEPSRQTFRETLKIDSNTWIRGMGWALWKTLCWPIADTPVNQVLQSLYNDFKSINGKEG